MMFLSDESRFAANRWMQVVEGQVVSEHIYHDVLSDESRFAANRWMQVVEGQVVSEHICSCLTGPFN